jgi:RNA polymerase sigma factor (sigma-70 family)
MKCLEPDEQLIERYLTAESAEAERAFQGIVARHGPMVMGICRQTVHQLADAEDAFQLTFLALALRAPSIQNRRVLGSWLHEVAYRKALRVRAKAAQTSLPPGWAARDVSCGEPEAHASHKELARIVRTEVDRLPEKYRTLVVSCYLEGKSNHEAAHFIGCPVGTLKARLWQAREMLRKRLESSVF